MQRKPPAPSMTRMFKHVHAPVVRVDVPCAIWDVSTGEVFTEWMRGDQYNYGVGKPNFPVPAIVPTQWDANDKWIWDNVRHALRWFNSIGGSGGINWTWAYFVQDSDAQGFNTWCGRNGYETRGVYPAWERGPIGVRYR